MVGAVVISVGGGVGDSVDSVGRGVIVVVSGSIVVGSVVISRGRILSDGGATSVSVERGVVVVWVSLYSGDGGLRLGVNVYVGSEER